MFRSAAAAGVHEHESIRETLDSIVVALILAFVFRAFVVEAFIIPTGSMAPTLYGAHATILCQDCGTEFAYGLKDLSDTREIREDQLVKQNSAATCPNCKHRNRNLKVNDYTNNPESGDRILVLKWPLDTRLASLGPKRWDVTVFKDPKDGETNFIKRLVGLPGEVLMIVDGDVYTVPITDLKSETVEELQSIAARKHQCLRRVPAQLDPKGREWELKIQVPLPSRTALDDIYDKLTIRDKTEVAQRSLWFTLYDHDFPPKSRGPEQPYWQVPLGESSGWSVADRRARFTDRQLKTDNIVLQGETFRGMYAYNVASGHDGEVVSDLRVRFVLTPESREGAVQIRLAKHGRVFWGAVGMDGTVSITEEVTPQSSSPLHLTGQASPLKPGRPAAISFEVLDYRLALHVDGREVLSTSRDRGSSSYYGPNVRELLRRRTPPVNSPQIHGMGGSFELTHLIVDRDVHYTTDLRGSSLRTLPPGGWGCETNPILLRDGEYFMLGDNTSASYDSRLWEVVDDRFMRRGANFQIGTVPQDQLIGQAFFVYWPSGRRMDWLPDWFPLRRFGIIPEVGRMRWIR